jgi:hypothetical protein
MERVFDLDVSRGDFSFASEAREASKEIVAVYMREKVREGY